MKIYDVAFIGMGASALATAKLNYAGTNHSLIGIDKEYHNKRNNFFAFWMTDWMENFSNLTQKKWFNWEFYLANECILHETKDLPYCTIRFQDWKKYCLDSLENLSIKTLNVHRIGNLKKYFEIELDNGEKVYAKKIYDSRTPKLEENKVKQHFFGYLIDTKQVIDNKKVTLMDFRVDQNVGLHFMYCLPISENKVLVESTVFSSEIQADSWYKDQIKKYIETKLKISEYTIVDEEKGALPMYDIRNKSYKNYINIGSRGGATKISTGYAFSFFLKNLVKHKDDSEKKHHSYFDQWMDKVFVNYLKNNNGTEKIFINMANSLNGNEFASFMMGISNTATKLKVIMSMPKYKFIKSALGTIIN